MRFILRAGSLFLCLISGILSFAQAQTFPVYGTIYRPAGTRYLVLKSPHFDVIFEEGGEKDARELAAILEGELPRTQALVGPHRRFRMPVVLNQFNDRSNGFVRVFPFKQEIEGVSLKGSLLSGRYTSWMWAVAPHELTHSVHAEAGRGFGVGAVLHWFAPDFARSLNLMLPGGVKEGIAVYHESRIQDGAGRLNFSLFQMQFRAAMLARHPWTLAQMLEPPAYSRPANRFYIGGSNFFTYLMENDGGRFFHRSTALHYRFPFLGYGIELWYGTGKMPARLGRVFRAAMRQRETVRIEALGTLTEPQVIAEGPGRSHRRPRWLDDSTLVAYVSGYDVRAGFYRYHARTGDRSLISHQRVTEDVYFSLNADRTALFFSRYVQDPFVSIKALAEVHRLDLDTGKVRQLTTQGRTLAPVTSKGTIWGVQNTGQFSQWVRIEEQGVIVPLTDIERASFVHLVPAPGGDSGAAVLRVNGHQGLFRASFGEDGEPSLSPWLLFEDAAIYDAAWSSDGRYVLFTADPGGIANIYAYDAQRDRVLKLTNVAYGAREPSLSPDGRVLAFVNYRHEQFDLVRIPFQPDEAEEVPRERAAFGRVLPRTDGASESRATGYTEGEARPYRAWSYLGPRMLYPTVRYENHNIEPGDTDLGLGVGLALQGADPLERWAYGAEAFYQDKRVWGRFVVETGQTVLRPFLSVSDLPSTVVAFRTDREGQVIDTLRVGREERGVALGVRLPMILQSNVFSTTASISMMGELEEERLFGPGGETVRPFRGRARLTPSAFLAYRLQANPRDLIPNTGTVLSATSSIDIWREVGPRRRALLTRLSQYLPVSLRRHTGVRLQAGLLTQNRGAIFNLDHFLPRGYEDEFLGTGTFARLGLDIVQPVWYIDNGFLILPFYFKALYVYGFSETVFPVKGQARRTRFSAVGAGLGLQWRLFYQLNFDVRIGASYLVEEQRWVTIFR